jgi:hypothetical protein
MSDDQEEMEKKAIAFMEHVNDTMPSSLRGSHVVVLCEHLITTYAPEESEAFTWLLALTTALKRHYTGEGEVEPLCDCAECTEARNRKIN